MPDFLVVIKYNDPYGENEQYLVEGVVDAWAARKYVLDVIMLGDDRGVPVEVTETPINKNKTQRFSNLGGFKD